jgi:hypothetical protein
MTPSCQFRALGRLPVVAVNSPSRASVNRGRARPSPSLAYFRIASQGSDPGSLTEQATDLVDDASFVRKLTGFEFRVNEFSVDGQLEATSVGRLQLESPDLGLVCGQDLFRQTDGFRLVVSFRAIAQVDIHRNLPHYDLDFDFLELFFLGGVLLAEAAVFADFLPNAISQLSEYFPVEPTRKIVIEFLLLETCTDRRLNDFNELIIARFDADVNPSFAIRRDGKPTATFVLSNAMPNWEIGRPRSRARLRWRNAPESHIRRGPRGRTWAESLPA